MNKFIFLKQRFMLLVILFSLSSCLASQDKKSELKEYVRDNTISDTISVVNKVDNSEVDSSLNVLNFDSLYLIPLTDLYVAETQRLIKSKEYVLASKKIVMSFWIEGDMFYFANNDKKKFQSFNFKTRLVKDEYSFPEMNVDYENPISKIFFLEGTLYCAGYVNTYEVNVLNGIENKRSSTSFGKNRNQTIRIFNDNSIKGLFDFPKNQLDVEIPDFGTDFILDQSTQLLRGVAIIDDVPNVLVEKEVISLESFSDFSGIDLEIYTDVDILFSNKEKICFVLKSFMSEIDDDLFVTFDLVEREILKIKKLKSHLPIESQIGDPVCFSTGTTYRYANNLIWRMRTTSEGLCIENWNDW